MGRILFFVLLGVGLYVAFRIWRAARMDERTTRSAEPSPEGETMVRCAHCGLNVPKSEALADGGRWFCSEAHRLIARDR